MITKNISLPVVGSWRSQWAETVIRLAHIYRNKLVELERDCSARIQATKRQHYPELAAIDEQIEAAETIIEEMNRLWRSRNALARQKVQDPLARAAKEKTVADLKQLRKAMREFTEAHSREEEFVNTRQTACKRRVWDRPAYMAALAGISEEKAAQHAALRAAAGIPWGTYQVVEEAMRKSASTGKPRFAPFTGEGTVATHIQGPSARTTSEDALLGRSKWLQLDLIPCPSGKTPRNRPRYRVRMRIDSDGEGQPLWLEVPIIGDRPRNNRWHGPLPDRAEIKWVKLHRRKIGTHYKYEVQFTCTWDEKPIGGVGLVAVEVGYRRVEAGLRVALWRGEDGGRGELVIPEARRKRWDRPSELQTIRDLNFNAMRNRLVVWLRDHPHPDWLRERCQTLPHWRASARLAALTIHWRYNRFAGDREIYDILEGWWPEPPHYNSANGDRERWRRQDRHLYDWQEFVRRENQRWRQDAYRKLACELRKRYGTVAMKKVQWKKLLKNPEPEETQDGALKEHYNIASPATLERCIQEKFGKPNVVWTKAARKTQTCHVCGSAEDFDQARDLHHCCSSCGTTWDQDENACLNTLREARSLLDSQEPLASCNGGSGNALE